MRRRRATAPDGVWRHDNGLGWRLETTTAWGGGTSKHPNGLKPHHAAAGECLGASHTVVL